MSEDKVDYIAELLGMKPRKPEPPKRGASVEELIRYMEKINKGK